MKILRKNRSAPTLALVFAVCAGPNPAHACENEPYIASVCIMAANFCPRGYAEANGQFLPINQYSALYSLVGTFYGGDGRTTFALPDLRGRTPVHVGNGPGLSPITQGQKGGAETVTQSTGQMATHSHTATTTANLRGKGGVNTGNSADLTGLVLAGKNNAKIYAKGPADATMHNSSIVATTTVATAGASQPQQNRSPFLGLRYCIALNGTYPSRD